MYQLFSSHKSITHLALAFTVLSSLTLLVSDSPILGCIMPTLAFQSPHAVVRVCGGMWPRVSSMFALTSSSSMPRAYTFGTGGI